MHALLACIARRQSIDAVVGIPHLTQQHVSLAGVAWLRWMHSNAGDTDGTSASIARLAESRGVLRLAGEGVHHFLNVRQ